MARMHSRDKGKSGSTKPDVKETPKWVGYKAAEIEALVSKLAKQGMEASAIGLVLRDTYGVPSVKLVTGKTISSILKAKKLEKKMPEDLTALFRRLIDIGKHLDQNKQDRTAKRGYQLTVSKINRLVKYYKKSGVIADDWKFRADQVSFYVE